MGNDEKLWPVGMWVCIALQCLPIYTTLIGIENENVLADIHITVDEDRRIRREGDGRWTDWTYTV